MTFRRNQCVPKGFKSWDVMNRSLYSNNFDKSQAKYISHTNNTEGVIIVNSVNKQKGSLLLILSIIRSKQFNNVKIISKSLDRLAISKSAVRFFRFNLNNCR